MDLIGALAEAKGSNGARVTASKNWTIDFFSRGPPPVAVDCLSRRNRTLFYEKLVKLLDIRKYTDARAILVVDPGSIGPEEVQLASSFEIFVVLDTDASSLRAASEGGELGEINGKALASILSGRSSKVARECRSAILELLEKNWFTQSELEEQLRWRFSPRTVGSQIKTLERTGHILSLGRTVRGESLFGLPGRLYPLRGDLSNSSRRGCLSKNIKAILEDCERPMTYDEIVARVGAGKHTVTALLRELRRQGFVRKSEEGWTNTRHGS